MVRRQIQLEEATDARLRRWSRQLGISVSEAVRRCVAAELSRVTETPSRRDQVRIALAACGKYRDPEGRSIAARHDDHLAAAYRS